MSRFRTALDLGVRYLCLTRYSWLSALMLLAIVPLSLGLMPRLLANLFVFDLPQQIFHVSWISIWCAATVLETLRTTTMNAHLRFDDYRIAAERFREAWGIEAVDETAAWYQSRIGWLLILLGLAAAVGIWHGIMHAAIESTVRDPATTWAPYVDTSDPAALRGYCWKWALAGLLTTLSLLMILNGLMVFWHYQHHRRGAARKPSWREMLYAKLHNLLGPGYFRNEPCGDSRSTWSLAPGHLRLFLYTTTFLAWYVVNYVTVTGNQRIPTEASDYVALFYALLSLLLLMYVLTGASFFWDRYRIPVPLSILGSMVILFSWFGTDHYYDLNLAPEDGTSRHIPELREVFDGWKFPTGPDGKRTLVVVDASGGGIQAAAWTAQVLTGLHEVYGNDFSRSVGLISSVSGGSVGTMFYLANRTEIMLGADPARSFEARGPREALSEQAIANIREAARSSALEATAWGLAYPDTLRTVFPFAVGKTIDRGWAIEQVWQQHMKSTSADGRDRSTLTLADLGRAIRENQLPIPVFNATLMESGQRLQISPIINRPDRHSDREIINPDAVVQLLDACENAQPLISTAARLSATFPYVTPAARALARTGQGSSASTPSAMESYHVVDGAYVDNEGAVTSVDWINRLLAHYDGKSPGARPFDRVLLLRIQAFPADIRSATGRHAGSSSGWRSALLGPLDAMMTVRSASQLERGDLEVALLTNVARARTQIQQRDAKLMGVLAEADVKDGIAPPGGAVADDDLDTNLSPAELARRQAMSRDSSALEAEISKTIAEQVQEKVLKAKDLEVVPVMIDFHSPDAAVMIPMSWKLTTRQKNNVDAAWQLLLDGRHPQRPLEVLDAFFARAAKPPQGLSQSSGPAHSAPTL